jgi:hypothetical protein
MKRLIIILMILFPFFGISQQNRDKSSPLNYIWMNVGNAGFSLGSATYTGIVISQTGIAYVVNADGAIDLRAGVMKYNGTFWDTVGNYGFTPGQAGTPSLAIGPDGEPAVAFIDYAHASKASVMKFDGANWVYIGDPGFTSSEIYYSISLAFNPGNGQPYVAFIDWAHNGKASVMNYNGSSWAIVGNAGFSVGNSVSYTHLAFNQSGEPYVAYADSAHSYKITVMKFNGTNWVVVGNEGFSTGAALNSTLSMSPAGEPYVAFPDNENDSKVTVMKFDGNNWVVLGSPQFRAAWATITSIAFNPSGEPFVAFTSAVDPYKATVIKFNGTGWSAVGGGGFSAAEADNTTLAFSPSGKPYVAYEDWGNGFKATVMKYDSLYVGIDENDASSGDFRIYPEPASDELSVELPESSLPCSLKMLNLNGQEVYLQTLSRGVLHIDISALPKGVYFIRLQNEKISCIRKFIKS